MKDIIIGLSLMFTLPSTILFWLWFIDLEKTKQIKLKDYTTFGGNKKYGSKSN